MVVNTNTRMYYPFLAVFARGWALILPKSLAMSARSFVGALNPFLAAVVDLRGHKSGMLLAWYFYRWPMQLSSSGQFIRYFFLSVILAMLGLSWSSFPFRLTLAIPFHTQRGRVIAITEMGWSLSFILLIPLVGFLIARSGWMGPFPALSRYGDRWYLSCWHACCRPIRLDRWLSTVSLKIFASF
jgi:hypothetical protein